MGETCVLCHSRWPKDKLYSACRCYKKSDSNRLHKECLAQIYANKETDELPRSTENYDRLINEKSRSAHYFTCLLMCWLSSRCPSCHDTYRVSVKYTFMFAWHRVFTCRSVGHLFEMVIIVCMIACGLFTLYLFQHSPEYLSRHRPGVQVKTDFATYLIYFLFGLTMCLVPFTLKKVYERWRTANSEVEVEIV